MKSEELLDQKWHNTWSASGKKMSRDPKLTRYMTLPSLLALLHRSKLHFTKLTDLRRYDAHEGAGGLMNNIIQTPISSGAFLSPSTPEFEAEQAAIVERIKAELSLPYEEQWPKFKAQLAKWDQEYANVFVSCWHENFGFTDFMWRVYARDDHGVALVTSSHALVESFSGVDLRKIGFGFVVYPYRDELVRNRHTEGHCALPPFLIKTKAFEPECEFRVFVQSKNPAESCDLDVDLKKLVHEIRISPLAPRWVDDAVRKTLDPICERIGIPKVAERERNLRD
jgi:hypothetical protein